jgi:hypothetical protein
MVNALNNYIRYLPEYLEMFRDLGIIKKEENDGKNNQATKQEENEYYQSILRPIKELGKLTTILKAAGHDLFSLGTYESLQNMIKPGKFNSKLHFKKLNLDILDTVENFLAVLNKENETHIKAILKGLRAITELKLTYNAVYHTYLKNPDELEGYLLTSEIFLNSKHTTLNKYITNLKQLFMNKETLSRQKTSIAILKAFMIKEVFSVAKDLKEGNNNTVDIIPENLDGLINKFIINNPKQDVSIDLIDPIYDSVDEEFKNNKAIILQALETYPKKGENILKAIMFKSYRAAQLLKLYEINFESIKEAVRQNLNKFIAIFNHSLIKIDTLVGQEKSTLVEKYNQNKEAYVVAKIKQYKVVKGRPTKSCKLKAYVKKNYKKINVDKLKFDVDKILAEFALSEFNKELKVILKPIFNTLKKSEDKLAYIEAETKSINLLKLYLDKNNDQIPNGLYGQQYIKYFTKEVRESKEFYVDVFDAVLETLNELRILHSTKLKFTDCQEIPLSSITDFKVGVFQEVERKVHGFDVTITYNSGSDYVIRLGVKMSSYEDLDALRKVVIRLQLMIIKHDLCFKGDSKLKLNYPNEGSHIDGLNASNPLLFSSIENELFS